MQLNRETFKAWLLSKPPEDTFDYFSTDNCLTCQFIRETTNAEKANTGGDYFRINGSDDREPLPDFIDKTLDLLLQKPGRHIGQRIFTFGAVQSAYLSLFPDTLVASPLSGVTAAQVTLGLETPKTQSVSLPQSGETL